MSELSDTAAPLSSGPSEGKFRVLAVDDERVILDLLEQMLAQDGIEVVGICSPVEALQKAKRQKFDALILDLYMPEMSGLLFHAKLRIIDPDLAARTVFISGYVTRDELRTHLSSAPNFLEKPFDSESLIDLIKKVLPAAPRRSASL